MEITGRRSRTICQRYACNNFYAEAADFGANVVGTYGVSDKSKAILDAAFGKKDSMSISDFT